MFTINKEMFFFEVLVVKLLVAVMTSPQFTSAQPPDSLYPDNGAVINLRGNATDQQIINSDKSWLVQFYFTWCGHCIIFAPRYQNAAESLKVWGDYLGLAAVNCNSYLNVEICRRYGSSAYPEVVFVPSHTEDISAKKMALPYETLQEVHTLVDYAQDKMRSLHPEAKPRSDVIISYKYPPATLTEHPPQWERVGSNNVSKLFSEDLIYALKHSLITEVGEHIEIFGDALQALKDYIVIQSLYYPDSSLRLSLKSLNDKVQNISGSLMQSDWSRFLLDSGMFGKLSVTDDLVRCKGSEPHYRGYPCTLWSLFHTLTIQATIPVVSEESPEDYEENASYNVLKAMSGYIDFFFDCQKCKENFAKMATDIQSINDTSNKTAVLWLWSTHNQVNKRLAGDGIEDPYFPKLQFPSEQDCPECKTADGEWNIDMVYEFLHDAYTDIRHGAIPVNTWYHGEEYQSNRKDGDQVNAKNNIESKSLGLRVEMSLLLTLNMVTLALFG